MLQATVRVVLRCRLCALTCNFDAKLDERFSTSEHVGVYQTPACEHPAKSIDISITQINLRAGA